MPALPFALAALIGVLLAMPQEAEAQRSGDAPEGMVLVPGGSFKMHVEYRWREGLTLDTLLMDDQGVRYRSIRTVSVPGFYIDETEVTNAEYAEFLEESGYEPESERNFLRHWEDGSYPDGRGDHPVRWVSLEDAQAYAGWADKRLPTEEEWQKAAQGTGGLDWPWGNLYDPDRANMDSDGPMEVGSFPEGASPYGVLDMTGNVWEWTDSYQTDGYHNFSWIRGGSYFFAKGSRWYMQGGPITAYQRTKYWHMTQALNRAATIGFRCVRDAE